MTCGKLPRSYLCSHEVEGLCQLGFAPIAIWGPLAQQAEKHNRHLVASNRRHDDGDYSDNDEEDDDNEGDEDDGDHANDGDDGTEGDDDGGRSGKGATTGGSR